MYKRKIARFLSVIIALTVIPFNSVSTYANDIIAFTEDTILVDAPAENMEEGSNSSIRLSEDTVENTDLEDYATISTNTLELSLDTEDDTEINAIVSKEPIDKDDTSEDSKKENETSDSPPLPGPVIVPSTRYLQAPVYNASSEYEEVQKYSASSSDNTANVIHYPIKIDTSTNLAYAPDWVNWATSQRLLTFIDGKANINVVYPSDNKVIIQRYDSKTIELLSSITITMPYPLFGCVTCDKDGYYYVTCGQFGKKMTLLSVYVSIVMMVES